ncbi:MAG: GntR family transcriptional regulator [Chelatococcus sp.]|nr:MAG: GntR family transcriptional regulator [Chelatococcus sp.]
MTPLAAQDSEGRPARERVYGYVREQILRGVFAGGSFVEEEEISSAMGVSRTPVREAFHRLEAERFIDLLPRRGALVRQVTAQELADLYETRRMIEGYAIARICRERMPLPESMEAILDQMDEIAGADHFARVELNREFHFTMVRALGNEVLSELYQSLGARQQRVAMRALAADPNRIERIRREHRDFLAALRAHDEERARAVLEEHLHPVVGVVSRLPGYAPAGTP